MLHAQQYHSNPTWPTLRNGRRAWFWMVSSPGRTGMGTDPALHELLKNLLEKAQIHLESLLFPTLRRRETCLLWMPYETYHLLPHPGPVPVHQHNGTVSYSGNNMQRWKIPGVHVSYHNQRDSKYLFSWNFFKLFRWTTLVLVFLMKDLPKHHRISTQ